MLWSPGAVAVEFRDVPTRHIVFQCHSLYFNGLLTRYMEVKYQIKQSSYMNI